MKIINFVIFVILGIIAILALIVAILTRSFQVGIIAFITGSVSYLAYKDYRDPQ